VQPEEREGANQVKEEERGGRGEEWVAIREGGKGG